MSPLILLRLLVRADFSEVIKHQSLMQDAIGKPQKCKLGNLGEVLAFVLTQRLQCSVTAPSPPRLGSKFLLLGRINHLLCATQWRSVRVIPSPLTNHRPVFSVLTNGITSSGHWNWFPSGDLTSCHEPPPAVFTKCLQSASSSFNTFCGCEI